MNILLSLRRHHYVARLSIFLIMVVLIAGTAGGCQPPPSETVEIQNWYDLDAVRDNLVGSYVLMENLDDTTDGYDDLVGDTVDGKGWQPIGTEGNAFKGTFDGNSHTIGDLFIDRPEEDEVGLFGRVQEGVVRNVGLVSVDVTGKKYVGALVGYSWKGTIDSDIRPPGSKTYSHGSVTGEENVGGLVGNNYDGTVNQCESSAEVFHASSAPDEDRWRTGGLVGLNSGNVLNCDYNGVVNGDRQVGGLVGLNAALLTIRGQVEDCGGQYSVNGNMEVGGVAGRNIGNIRRASFIGDVNGIMIGDGLVALNEGATVNAYASDTALQGSYVGGVVGVNEGTVDDCSAEATVEGYQYVGGLAGTNNGTVENCSADSKVTGDSNIGGLVGENQGTLEKCSSCGEVTGDSSTGCLVGHNTGTVNNSDSTSWVTGTSDGGDLVGWNEGVISGVGPQVIELDFVTFWPSVDFQAKGSIDLWGYTDMGHSAWMDKIAARVLAETDGYEINWNVFYGGAEPSNQIYSLVRDGAYDVGVTGPSWSPGIFPLWEGTQYPGNLYRKNAYTMSMTLQALYDEFTPLQEEMAAQNLKVMHFWSPGPGYFLMTPGNEVRMLADFAGQTIRVANPASVLTIEALGGEPLYVPLSVAIEKFEAGLLDGILSPTDVLKGFGLGAYVKHCTFAPFSFQFVYVKVMNEATWNALPAEVQTIFNEVNAAWPAYYGQLRTWGEVDGLQYCYDNIRGFTYYDLPNEDPEEYQNWVDATAHLAEEWIGGDSTRQALWDKFVELDEYYANIPPYSNWTFEAGPPPVPTFQ
jgi:TRAP-type C4-dicarboxylate transport system substrate-binding protein